MGYSGLAQLGYELGLLQPPVAEPGNNPLVKNPNAKEVSGAIPQNGANARYVPPSKYDQLYGPTGEAPQYSPNGQLISAPTIVRGSPPAPASTSAIGSPASYGINVPSNLASLINTSTGTFGDLTKPFGQTFTAPTLADLQNDPGYQARLNLGTDALERSAAARGNVLTGGTLKDLNQFAQDYASNEYNNLYGRNLNTFTTNYNAYNNDQQNKYNRLASLVGLGQSSTNQLAGLGSNFANSGTNILVNSGNAQASGINNAAAARGSGYAASGNIWGNTISSAANNIGQLIALRNMGGGSPGYPVDPNSLLTDFTLG
jgi:hypothetical protein